MPRRKKQAAAPAARSAMRSPSDANGLVRAVSRTFHASIPMAAQSSGHADLREDARFAGNEYPVPDGAYRVAGNDWILTFAKGRVVSADRAAPPHFGGPDVVSVPNG